MKRPRNAPPRVLLLVTRLVGGAAHSAMILSEELRREGFDVGIISGVEREGDLSVPTDIPHFVLRSLKRAVGPINDFRAFRSLLDVFRRQRPDVVIAHMSKVGVLGRIAARRTGVPVVVRIYHGHVLRGHFSAPANTSIRLIERALAHWTDALVAVSGSVKNDLLRLRVGAPSQWHVIPLGVDLPSFNSEGLDKETARRHLGLPVQGPVVGTVGRLTPVKDHATFLQAAQLIKRQHPTVAFAVAGDGELRERLEQQARKLLGDRVLFLGWMSDLKSLYAALDVVVLTSRQEGTPRVLIEAGAAARPVVATRVGGVAEVVRDGETGLIVSPGDSTAVAEATLRLLGDPLLAEAMGKAARSRVSENYSARQFGKGVADLLLKLLSEHSART